MPPASAAGTAVTVIVGDEELLVERAVHAAVAEAAPSNATLSAVRLVEAARSEPPRPTTRTGLTTAVSLQ